jgi:hypothetical protein
VNGALATQSRAGSAKLAKIVELENKLHSVVESLVDEALTQPMKSRDKSRIVLTSLQMLRYARDITGKEIGEGEMDENDLTALPTQDLEKLVKLGTRLLGKERVKELAG